MCGIAGILSFDPDLPVTPGHLESMSRRIAHRGPDADQSLILPGLPSLGLAFRRLAVIDPDPRSNQPVHTPDRRFTLVFNGEIYNYRQLREQLDYPWKTQGDAEVLLAALTAWGTGALDKLNGMFALALWDDQEKTLLLARDRMGQKPLYLSIGRSSVAFASELSALDAWPDWEQDLDPESMVDYLRFGTSVAPRTMMTGAHQILPGHYLRIRRIEPTMTQTRYFDPNPPPGSVEGPDDTLDFKVMIRQSVHRQLVADVPIGVFLSGGIDSSVIACCARQQGKIQTFSIGFDDPRYDETPFARQVARHLDTDHHEFRVRPDSWEDLQTIIRSFGEPFADSSAIPTHHLSRETRRHVTVALSGEGGDELFAGYDRYQAIRFPTGWLRPFIPLGKLLSRGDPKSRSTRLGRLIESSSLCEAKRYLRYLSLFPDPMIRRLLNRERLSQTYERLWDELRQTRDRVQTAMSIDRLIYLPNDLLAKVDRTSMLHSLEVRSPFMDHELVLSVSGLSTRQLLRSGKKSLLKQAFASDLPEWVFTRPKTGFAVPIGAWLRGPLRSLLVDHLQSQNSIVHQYLNSQLVRQLIQEHLEERVDHSQRLYALLVLDIWHRGRLT